MSVTFAAAWVVAAIITHWAALPPHSPHWAALPPHSVQAAAPRSISIEAERFNFTPSRIKVAAGEEVEIRLRSADTAHGFKIEGSGINVEIPKRGKGEIVVRYKAAAPGRYRFACSRMCGAGHDFMQGEIVVSDASDAKER